jgi:hypothetical protein
MDASRQLKVVARAWPTPEAFVALTRFSETDISFSGHVREVLVKIDQKNEAAAPLALVILL